MGYKVTGPNAGVWHYEYALYNQNLDRAIQSFSMPLGPGVNISNIGFHAPPQHPGFAHDGTQGDAGYSSTPWTNDYQPGNTSITWNCETIAQNANANAIRFGTLYNFRFDADQPPQTTNATVGFFKTGSPMTVEIQAPQGGTPTPTPTSTQLLLTPRLLPSDPDGIPVPRERPTPHLARSPWRPSAQVCAMPLKAARDSRTPIPPSQIRLYDHGYAHSKCLDSSPLPMRKTGVPWCLLS